MFLLCCAQLLSHVRLFATLWPVVCQPSLSMGILQARILEYAAHALLQGIFLTQRSNPGFPALQMDSLPSEPPGKPMNTGMGSLFLLQGIFLTQESNWGFLPCRWIFFLPAELPGKALCSFQLVLIPDMLLMSSNLSFLLALFAQSSHL